MKKFLSIMLIMLLCISLIGCGAQKADEAPAEEIATEAVMPTLEAPGKVDAMEFLGGEANGGWAMVAAAIADKANPYFEGFPITATTGGAVANPAVLASGDAQIGLTQTLFLNKILAGEEPYDEPCEDLRAIASLESTALYYIVGADCPYNTLGELINSGEKMKVGAMVASASSSIVGVMVLQEYGLSAFEDLQEDGSEVYIADGSALYEAFGDRHFDLLITNKSISDAALKELLSKRESKILAIDDEVIASLESKYGWGEITIPGGTYENNDNDVSSIRIKSVLIVRSDVPDELAYILAKVCCEEKAYLETIQSSYKAFDVSDMVNNTVVEMHPGALKYWTEAGYIK